MNQNDLLFARRFFPTQTLLWCITLVGFASIARTLSNSSKQTRTAVLTAAIVIATLAASAQFFLVPWFVRGAYLLRSTSLYSSSERRHADAVFARYRQEGKPEEPVVASSLLFRYAHDRNFFWLNRLYGRPAPIWILGDSADPYAPFRISTDMISAQSGIRLEDYALVDRRGRFALFRKRE
jgi:Zn-dependent protease with chaperone function